MTLDSIYKQVSEELNIPVEVVKRAYVDSWRFIKGKISELPLKETISKEDFETYRCSFNLPSLGKLYTTYDRYKNLRENYLKYLKENEIEK